MKRSGRREGVPIRLKANFPAIAAETGAPSPAERLTPALRVRIEVSGRGASQTSVLAPGRPAPPGRHGLRADAEIESRDYRRRLHRHTTRLSRHACLSIR